MSGDVLGARRRGWARWALLVGLLLTGLGCGGRSGRALDEPCPELGCPCVGPDRCAADLVCANGRCALPEAVAGQDGFGAICEGAEDCRSGRCVLAGDGSYGRCTTGCTADSCPEGWRCAAVQGAPQCLPERPTLCLECGSDSDCDPSGSSACIRGRCGLDCTLDGCPAGYQCEAIEIAGTPRNQCVPTSGSCGCGAAAFTVACRRGSCRGEALCSGGSLGACSAPSATEEVCSGADEDCDGRVDTEDPDLQLPPGHPVCQLSDGPGCVGAYSCAGAEGWTCAPAAPLSESCNGVDDDCDGEADEDFLDPSGLYLSVDHCGGCGIRCSELIGGLADAEGAVQCELRDGSPTCAPLACAPGLAPTPSGAPIACEMPLGSQCRACASANDCGSSDRCVELDGEFACLQGCGVEAPYPGCTGELGAVGCCPEGSLCEEVDGVPVCRPSGNSCRCGPEQDGLRRSCVMAGACAGIQVCGEADGTWAFSECSAEGIAEEQCNGLDDDCDGRVDEEFLNTQGSGTYDVAEHCGRCFESCLVLPRAEGRCDASGTPGCAIESCQSAPVAGGAVCRSDADCALGYGCNQRLGFCERACTRDADCGGGRCVDRRCGPACSADADCDPEARCVGGACVRNLDFQDLDGEVANGCECGSVGRDAPDELGSWPSGGERFRDANCDGVDGDVARSLFVRSGASGSGTQTQPLGSLAEALGRFDPSRHDAILVAEGSYGETLRLRAGVAIYGGYRSDFAVRDLVRHSSELRGAGGQPPVVAEGLGSAVTTLAGFVVRGPEVDARPGASQAGAASVGIWVSDSPGLRLVDLRVVGGRGGDGGDGGPGSDGDDGASGQPGLGAAECSSTSCTGEQLNGGAGGRNPSCSGSAGNRGGHSSGDRTVQEYDGVLGRNGQGGTNARYTNGGDPSFAQFCKYDCTVPGDLEGDDAQNGTTGAAGIGGAGCDDSLGSLQGGAWRADAAAAGQAGGHGEGGGGGGAGGGVVNDNPPGCTIGRRVGDLGSTGGGGGAGGCRGSGGGAGGSGGASIGIFVVSGQPPTFIGVRVEPGTGGDGGAGGDGGRGGLGGPGGLGGVTAPPAWCGGSGGRGGRGGDGGGGGGGGGGCGGPSVGLWAARPGPTSGLSVVSGGVGGAAGAGGRSASGQSGVSGAGGVRRAEVVQ